MKTFQVNQTKTRWKTQRTPTLMTRFWREVKLVRRIQVAVWRLSRLWKVGTGLKTLFDFFRNVISTSVAWETSTNKIAVTKARRSTVSCCNVVLSLEQVLYWRTEIHLQGTKWFGVKTDLESVGTVYRINDLVECSNLLCYILQTLVQ